MYEGKISYCTPVMGRLHHLKVTLPHNLEVTDNNTEHVILNYSDKTGVHEWMMESGLALHPKVRYVHYQGATRWRMAHAKNVGHLEARDGIVVNLDADNLLGPNTTAELRRLIDPDYPKLIVTSSAHGGFIGFFRDQFVALGGYDEFYNDWSYDDTDLKERAKASGFRTINLPGDGFRVIEHSNDERVANTGQTIPPNRRADHLIVRGHHEGKRHSQNNIAAGKLVANEGRNWGV